MCLYCIEIARKIQRNGTKWHNFQNFDHRIALDLVLPPANPPQDPLEPDRVGETDHSQQEDVGEVDEDDLVIVGPVQERVPLSGTVWTGVFVYQYISET